MCREFGRFSVFVMFMDDIMDATARNFDNIEGLHVFILDIHVIEGEELRANIRAEVFQYIGYRNLQCLLCCLHQIHYLFISIVLDREIDLVLIALRCQQCLPGEVRDRPAKAGVGGGARLAAVEPPQ